MVVERWAASEPVRGREYFTAQQMQDVTEIKFTIRHHADVRATDRVVWRGRNHEILSVIDPRGQREFLELMCMDGLRDGRN